jgi:hypothetical protein
MFTSLEKHSINFVTDFFANRLYIILNVSLFLLHYISAIHFSAAVFNFIVASFKTLRDNILQIIICRCRRMSMPNYRQRLSIVPEAIWTISFFDFDFILPSFCQLDPASSR